MDIKQRSPSFFCIKQQKPSTEKKNSPTKTQKIIFKTSTEKKNSPTKTQKITFKPVPCIELLKSMNMYSPIDQPSTVKKVTMKATRMAELNLDEFRKPPEVTSKNVRKQLWPMDKGGRSNGTVERSENKLRRGTIMKTTNSRKTLYSRPSLVQTKKNSIKKKSLDDTIPLMEMDQFTVTKIKRTLFSSQHQQFNNNQRSATSRPTRLSVPNFGKKLIPPRIVITPAAEKKTKKLSIQKPTCTTNSNIKTKKVERDNKDETIDLLFAKISILEEKLEEKNKNVDECKVLLNTICDHLGINVMSKKSPKKMETITEGTKEELKTTSPCTSKTQIAIPIILNYEPITTVEKNKSENLVNTPENPINKNKSENLVNTPENPINKNKSENLVNTPENPINKNKSENLVNTPKNPINKNKSENLVNTPENPINKNKSENLVNTPENPINKNKSEIVINVNESSMKLKKTWITQFEQIEKRLFNNANDSIDFKDFKSSPDDSPVAPLQLDEIMNTGHALSIKKSQSTSNLLTDTKKALSQHKLFKSRETDDLLTESICVYNKLRDEVPKLLSTPVHKMNKNMSFMTPSVRGNEKKLISRIVQEQLLRLNDC